MKAEHIKNIQHINIIETETVEKEVQDTSCRWSGGVPQFGGYRGLIKAI